MTFSERVYKLVRRIPSGKVLSYSQVAYYLNEGSARSVGTALSKCPDPVNIPWQRVITNERRASRNLPEGQQELQHILLEAEGVPFDDSGHVLTSAFWTPTAAELHDLREPA